METIVENDVKKENKVVDSRSQKESRVLLVKWRDTVIGILLKEQELGFFFKYYREGMKAAKEQGFSYLIGFRDQRKVYTSKQLFPVFQSRVPTKQRRDLERKLDIAGLEQYDEFSYLAATGGRLNTDSISFQEVPIEKLRSLKNLNRVLRSYSKNIEDKPRKTQESDYGRGY